MDTAAFVVVSWFVITLLLIILTEVLRRQLRNARREIERLQGVEFSSSVRNTDKFTQIGDSEMRIDRIDVSKIKDKDLKDVYLRRRSMLSELEKQIALYDERLAFAQLGLYEPHFDFTDSEMYKSKINEIRKKQKELISSQRATRCPRQWAVDGSESKGKIMMNRQIRLTMRAFNNECDAAIANVRWNNAVAMENRILAASNAINKENSSMLLEIADQYVSLKLDELRATHEYREQTKREKDSRAEMARAEREEKKLLAEADAAEREERKYKALLDKARQEVGADAARVKELEAALELAHQMSERARAMAEMTKSGYVYVISNVGSFGEDVVKIGLTRRLDPDDRIRELGDASVPFFFDTHAMIYSDEAPALEAALHRQFADRRINTSNLRKEFFRVTLDEVELAVKEVAPTASFFKDREAQEWHETLAKRNKSLLEQSDQNARNFPPEI